jgi:hypothetical protein
VHAAFAFRNEADLSRLDLVQDYYLPGILVRLVQRGLQYMELEANVYRDDGSSADPPKFEVLTAADILRAKSPAALKGLVQDRREASTTTSATRVFPEAREAAACGAELDADVDAVFAACWNPEGTRLACYTQGVQCSIWEVGPCGGDPGKGAGEPRRIVLRRGGSSVGASAPLVWSPDGLQVGMGLDDGWVCIWDPEGVLLSLLLQIHCIQRVWSSGVESLPFCAPLVSVAARSACCALTAIGLQKVSALSELVRLEASESSGVFILDNRMCLEGIDCHR